MTHLELLETQLRRAEKDARLRRTADAHDQAESRRDEAKAFSGPREAEGKRIEAEQIPL
jgi:hypothetical protein